MTTAQPTLGIEARLIISTGGSRRIEMPKPPHSRAKPDRSLLAPVAAALAVKAVALTILYFAFFVPAPPPTAERSAAAIYGLSTGR